MANKARWWLLLPLWLAFGADLALTLGGQPDCYWNGDRTSAVEANPVAHLLLSFDPLLFVAIATLWPAIVSTLVFWLPIASAGWLSALASVLHVIGAATWLTRFSSYGWLVAIAFLAIAAEFSWWCWRRSGWIKN